MSTVLTFHPAFGTRLLDYAAEVQAESLEDICFNDHDSLSYISGSVEGELAFAMAVKPDSASDTISRCKSALLLRLGLAGDGLTLEQQRLRGWIIGLLGGLAASLEEGAQHEHRLPIWLVRGRHQLAGEHHHRDVGSVRADPKEQPTPFTLDAPLV